MKFSFSCVSCNTGDGMESELVNKYATTIKNAAKKAFGCSEEEDKKTIRSLMDEESSTVMDTTDVTDTGEKNETTSIAEDSELPRVNSEATGYTGTTGLTFIATIEESNSNVIVESNVHVLNDNTILKCDSNGSVSIGDDGESVEVISIATEPLPKTKSLFFRTKSKDGSLKANVDSWKSKNRSKENKSEKDATEQITKDENTKIESSLNGSQIQNKESKTVNIDHKLSKGQRSGDSVAGGGASVSGATMVSAGGPGSVTGDASVSSKTSSPGSLAGGTSISGNSKPNAKRCGSVTGDASVASVTGGASISGASKASARGGASVTGVEFISGDSKASAKRSVTRVAAIFSKIRSGSVTGGASISGDSKASAKRCGSVTGGASVSSKGRAESATGGAFISGASKASASGSVTGCDASISGVSKANATGAAHVTEDASVTGVSSVASNKPFIRESEPVAEVQKVDSKAESLGDKQEQEESARDTEAEEERDELDPAKSASFHEPIEEIKSFEKRELSIMNSTSTELGPTHLKELMSYRKMVESGILSKPSDIMSETGSCTEATLDGDSSKVVVTVYSES